MVVAIFDAHHWQDFGCAAEAIAEWGDRVREVEDEGGGIDDVAMELTEFFAACDEDIFGLIAFFGVFEAIEAIDDRDYSFLSAFLECFVGGFEEFFVDEFEEVIGLGFEVLAQSGACVGVAFEFGAKFADAEEVSGDFACGAGGDFADQGNVTFA